MRHRVTQIISTRLILCPYAPYAAVNTQSYLKDLKNAYDHIKTVEECMKNQNCDDNCKDSFDHITAMQDKLDNMEKDFNKRKDDIQDSVVKLQNAAEKHGRSCQSKGRKSVLHCTDLRHTDQSTCEKYFETDGDPVVSGGSTPYFTYYSWCTYKSGSTCTNDDKHCGSGASRKNFDELKKAIKAMSIQKGVPTKRIEALMAQDQTLRKQVQDAVDLNDTYKKFLELIRDNKALIKTYGRMCQSQWSS